MKEIDPQKVFDINRRKGTIDAMIELGREIGSPMRVGGGMAQDGVTHVRYVDDIRAEIINSFTEQRTGKFGSITGVGPTPKEASNDLLKKLLEPTLVVPEQVKIEADEEVCLAVGPAERPMMVRVKQTGLTPRIGTIR